MGWLSEVGARLRPSYPYIYDIYAYRGGGYRHTYMQVGARLRAPSLSAAFVFWVAEYEHQAAQRQLAAQEAESRSLEGQLKQATFEMGQVKLVNTALSDEVSGLRASVIELSAEVKEKGEALGGVAALKKEVAELRELYAEAEHDVEVAETRATVAEEVAAGQQKSREELLRRLLDEQRKLFDEETANLKEELRAKTEAQEKEARVEVLRKVATRRLANHAISAGWSSWVELWEAKVYAHQTLSRIGGKLQVRGVASAFTVWAHRWRATLEYYANASTDQLLALRDAAQAKLETELRQVKSSLEVVAAQKEALQAKLRELSGSHQDVEQLLEEQAKADKEQRIAAFGRQVLRRIVNNDLRKGWAAWQEMSDAKTYSHALLKHTALRLRNAQVSDAFALWSEEVIASRATKVVAILEERAVRLAEEVECLEMALVTEAAAHEIRLATAETLKNVELQRQLVELTGSAEEQAAVREECAKEERIELLRRQVARRILHVGLSDGWQAWVELRESKRWAMASLQRVANRLSRPEMAYAFACWEALCAARYEADAHAEVLEGRRREAGLQSEYSNLTGEIAVVRAECEARLAQAEKEKKLALERQLIELTGNAEQLVGLLEAKAKEERVELMRRQMARRILNQSIIRGFSAWVEAWEAHGYVVHRLREVGNKLRAPSMAAAFGHWLVVIDEAKRGAAMAELEKQSKSLEGQLRQARFETGQLGLVRTAQDDEIKGLRERLDELSEMTTLKGAALAEASILPKELDRLREATRIAEAAAREAIDAREEAERDVQRQAAANKELLEKLLAEQRKRLEAEWRKTNKSLSAETEQRQILDAEMARLKEELTRKERTSAEEVARLKEEVKRLTVPPPKKEPKKSAFSKIDLDESPGAPPISQQLGTALRQNSTRVMDLFRQWDADGDGEVSRAEFHKAMPALGLDVPKEAVDELFSEWDKDGGGSINYQELRKILQARPAGGAGKAKK